MRQNVQKTIPIYLQPPYKNGAPVYLPENSGGPLLKFFFLLPPVPSPALAKNELRRLGACAHEGGLTPQGEHRTGAAQVGKTALDEASPRSNGQGLLNFRFRA